MGTANAPPESLAGLEYRTHPLPRELILPELTLVCANWLAAGVKHVAVSFGWDSNLPIDAMWKDVQVPVGAVVQYLEAAERAGTIEIGKTDVFMRTEEIELTLCHESDVHVSGTPTFVTETVRRWFDSGYEPYSLIARV
jgi:hypothetical protein